MAGTLFVVATPIGNMEDISARALAIFRKVSLIACEDTRVTTKLLSRYGITTRTVSYHEHNERRRAEELLDKLDAGQDIALASDAGTPGISDPGYRLISAARKQGLPVRTIPGASAVVAALAVSGLPTSSFCFHGFLPARPGARKKAIDSLARLPHTLVLFETARRAPGLLEALAKQLGPRPAFVAREMTKVHEEHRYGTLPELARWARENSLRGELTVVLAGEDVDAIGPVATEPDVLLGRFLELTAEGLSRRQAVKQLSQELRLPSRQVYQEILKLQASKSGGSLEDSRSHG